MKHKISHQLFFLLKRHFFIGNQLSIDISHTNFYICQHVILVLEWDGLISVATCELIGLQIHSKFVDRCFYFFVILTSSLDELVFLLQVHVIGSLFVLFLACVQQNSNLFYLFFHPLLLNR